MCGIIGFTGNDHALSKLISGLDALEYRGYDSAGVAYFAAGDLRCVKSKGRLSSLCSRLEGISEENISSGIGHTRWATHGDVSDRNSHPHGNGRIYGVHNGIIENYEEISDFLKNHGYSFESDTDTERAILLIDYLYGKLSDPVKAMHEASRIMKGSFAIGVVLADIPDKVFAMRRDSPLLACPSEEGAFIASDISAVLKYTKRFAVIDEDEVAVLSAGGIEFVSPDGKRRQKSYENVSWDVSQAEKGGFPHFMLKEIHEEADAVKRTVGPIIKDGRPKIDLPVLSAESIKNLRRIHIVACGTAMHAGLMGKYAIEKLAHIPVNVEIASEFRYRDPVTSKDDLVIIISQSGETADSLAALRLAKKRGIHTLAVVNVHGSTIAREADSVLYTHAGPEIAVASTKAYSVQLALLYLLAIHFGEAVGALTECESRELCEKLKSAPQYIERTMKLDAKCREIAEKYSSCKNIFFIGRGQDHALCTEAALKMKEISYIHCEAYAAGELKHGTISLIEKGTPVFVFATEKELFDKTVNNVKEVKARGASVLMFMPDDFDLPSGVADDVIRLPSFFELFMPLCAVLTAQLLAYYTAVTLGCDVDKPRNLAKSVTVE